MKFFVPDWDDRVDPDYDFLTDRPTLDRVPYRDDRYAHELMSEHIYDGVLVSRMALGESGPKRHAVLARGLREYLRLGAAPRRLELLGDCGAFGYIRAKDPPYETAEMIEFYDRLGFDYGVSIDHLVVAEFEHERRYRYDLTLHNAEEFIRQHRRGGYSFTPIGAVQGWDPPSYVAAAVAEVEMGYHYLGLGGLARSNTRTVYTIVKAVSEAVRDRRVGSEPVKLHVFGVARLTLLEDFIRFSVHSVDSAAPLRQAWLSADDNYYWIDRTYAAIRIPDAGSERAKQPRSRKLKEQRAEFAASQLPLGGVSDTLLGRPDVSLKDLQVAERAALEALRAYDRGALGQRATMAAIMAYDGLLGARAYAADSAARRELYARTLSERPWQRCRCSICDHIGVEVIIFRGNNRNRRRGFHNLRMVRRRLERARQSRWSAGADRSNELEPLLLHGSPQY